MKVDISKDVSTSISGAVDFKVSDDVGKLFAMLGDYLYSDRQFCVLYELSTNADDEHKASGVDRPFDVILPTQLSNKLIIRDYGRGLCEADVYKYLATYGESGKSNDDGLIGGWGLGFKSVASVSSTWNVISRHNGSESHYIIYVTEHGTPAIMKTVTKETIESGLEIQIPIETGQERIWRDLPAKVYKHFPNKPNVIGAEVRWSPQKVNMHGAGWELLETNNYNYDNCRVVTSYREYILNKEKLKESIDKKLHFMLSMPFQFNLNVGEVNLSPSRELLQYTTRSVSRIEAALLNAYNDILARITICLDVETDELKYKENIFKVARDIFGTKHDITSSAAVQEFFLRVINGKFGIKALPGDAQLISIPISGIVRCYNGERMKEVKHNFNCWRSSIAVVRTDYKTDIQYLNVKISKLDRCSFFLKDAHDSAARVRGVYKDSSNYVFLFENDTMPLIMKGRLKLASSLPKVIRVPRAVAKKAALSGPETARAIYLNSYKKVTVDIKVHQFAYVRVKSFVNHSFITNETMQKIHWLQGKSVIVLAFKAADTPIKGVLPIDEYLQKRFAELTLNPKMLQEKYAFQWKLIVDEFRYGSVLKSFLSLFANTETIKPSVWNTERDAVKDVMDHFRDTKTFINTSLTQEYNDIATMMKLPKIEYKKLAWSAHICYDKLIATYPMLKYQNDMWEPATLKQYLELCDI